jgi:hypothetical protein
MAEIGKVLCLRICYLMPSQRSKNSEYGEAVTFYAFYAFYVRFTVRVVTTASFKVRVVTTASFMWSALLL